MERDEFNFTAVGKDGNLLVMIRCRTYNTVIRSCKQIMKHNPSIASCYVEDRKKNILKVIKEKE